MDSSRLFAKMQSRSWKLFCCGTQSAFAPEYGRWPEIQSPALRLGPILAFLGTTASMIAVINNVVAGVGIALLVRVFSPSTLGWIGAMAGILAAALLTLAFYAYQRWRFSDFDWDVH
jgi:hypothetical protein